MENIKRLEVVLNADEKAMNELLKIIPVIVEQVLRFDGKVANIKLENAINEKLEETECGARIDYKGKCITIYTGGRASLPYVNQVGRTEWISSEYRKFDMYLIESLDNFRINAKVINEQIEDYVKRLELQIKATQEDRMNLETFQAERERIIKEIETLNYLPKSYTVRDSIKIKTRY